MDIDIFKVVKLLMPAKHGDIHGQKQWEWTISGFMLTILVVMVVHLAAACGYLKPLFSGFVQDNDPRIDRINFVALQVLAIQMDSKATKICDDPSDLKLDDELGVEINHLEQAYAYIAGKGYDLTRCARN